MECSSDDDYSSNEHNDGSSRSKNSHPHRRRVSWGNLTIYVMPNLLGDNPAVSEGAPLTIGWKHESKSILAIDYYEYLRQSHPRRRRKELAVPGANRDAVLLGLGYSLHQLLEATEEVRKIRKSRQANMKGTWEKFKAVFESNHKVSNNRQRWASVLSAATTTTTTTTQQKKNTPSSAKPKIVAAKCG